MSCGGRRSYSLVRVMFKFLGDIHYLGDLRREQSEDRGSQRGLELRKVHLTMARAGRRYEWRIDK